MKVPAGWNEKSFRIAMYMANKADRDFKPLLTRFSEKQRGELKKAIKEGK